MSLHSLQLEEDMESSGGVLENAKIMCLGVLGSGQNFQVPLLELV